MVYFIGPIIVGVMGETEVLPCFLGTPESPSRTSVLFCLNFKGSFVNFLPDVANALDFILKVCHTFPLASSWTQTDLTLLTAALDEPGAVEGQWIQEEPADRSFFSPVLTKPCPPLTEKLRLQKPSGRFCAQERPLPTSPPKQVLIRAQRTPDCGGTASRTVILCF